MSTYSGSKPIGRNERNGSEGHVHDKEMNAPDGNSDRILTRVQINEALVDLDFVAILGLGTLTARLSRVYET